MLGPRAAMLRAPWGQIDLLVAEDEKFDPFAVYKIAWVVLVTMSCRIGNKVSH